MKEISKRKSRYGDERILYKLSESWYQVTGKSEYRRFDNPYSPSFVDFEGGPMIQIGDNLNSIFNIKEDLVIKNITLSENLDKVLLHVVPN